jgi:starch phosphorylase
MPYSQEKSIVVYLSMEIALENDIKTYAGGLGVLAGDILRSAADSGFPMVGVTLLSDQGYLRQRVDKDGKQASDPDPGYDFSKLEKLPQQAEIFIGPERVVVGVWRYLIKGLHGSTVPVYLLDTNIESNRAAHRGLTGQLYGGDMGYRLQQEIVLGRGGVKILQALGYQDIKKFHLNEGHGALAAVELFLNSPAETDSAKVEEVRKKCVFTTHTPLPKAQDIFAVDYLLKYQPDFPSRLAGLSSGNQEINFTRLGLYFSAYVNAVSRQHQKSSQKMFPEYKIRDITNGVNPLTWSASEFCDLYDEYLPGWQDDNAKLLGAASIPSDRVWSAHRSAKNRLLQYISDRHPAPLDVEVFTIGFARRFTPYKRPTFLLQDIDRLLAINDKVGKIQIIYAGKAHPQDIIGQDLIRFIYETKKKLAGKIGLVFLEDYDLDKARLMAAGVDLWLNTPEPPYEASGTSGMKAAHNGVPQLSTMDGWWPEGYVKDKTGWIIREARDGGHDLYDVLEKEIIPLYYKHPDKWREIMRQTISLNASRFNTGRVLWQYIEEAYGNEKG